jgi:phenylacetate-CoA oxygenase PaaI subunit
VKPEASVERAMSTSALRPEVFAALLALADDELVMGHRHSQWLGLSPFLEEDLTLASIAQDEMGHARALYGCIWPDWLDREADVVRRPASQWRSCELVERVAPSWEWALIRHWVYDTVEPMRWRDMEATFGVEIEGFGALAAKVAQEERFHRHHAEQLVIKLGLANGEANDRLQRCVDAVLPLLATLVHAHQLGEAWETLRVGAERAGLRLPSVETLLGLNAESNAGSNVEPNVKPNAGLNVGSTGSLSSESSEPGRMVRHDDFAEVHASLLAVIRVDPVATW